MHRPTDLNKGARSQSHFFSSKVMNISSVYGPFENKFCSESAIHSMDGKNKRLNIFYMK